MSELKECPFCKGGGTNVLNVDPNLNDVQYALPKSVGGVRIYFAVEHWCEKIKDTNARHLSFYGKSREEVIELWNLRAE